MAKPPKKMGRRRKAFNQVAADYICERLATSELSVEEVVQELNDGKPGITLWNVFTWRRENPDFSKSFAQAREDQADYLADMAFREARNVRVQEVKRQAQKIARTADGKPGKPDAEWVELRKEDNVARSRLIVETIWKRAGHMKPKTYRENRPAESGEAGPNEQIAALQKALLDGPVESEPTTSLPDPKPAGETKQPEGETKPAPDETKPTEPKPDEPKK